MCFFCCELDCWYPIIVQVLRSFFVFCELEFCWNGGIFLLGLEFKILSISCFLTC